MMCVFIWYLLSIICNTFIFLLWYEKQTIKLVECETQYCEHERKAKHDRVNIAPDYTVVGLNQNNKLYGMMYNYSLYYII